MAGSTIGSVGINMKLYRNTGTFGVPVWSLVPNVADAKVDQGTADEVEVSVRGSGGFAQFEPGLKQASFEWDMRWKQSDADITALITDWQNGALVEFAFADGPIATSGTNYWRQECKVFALARDEPLSGSVVAHVVAKPCSSSNAPSFNTVP